MREVGPIRVAKSLGFYYLRSRYYNMPVGRFTTPDSFGGILLDPASLHRYLYASLDPINRYDPSGNLTLPEISVTTAIESVLQTIRTVSTVETLANAKNRLSLAFGIAETAAALLNPVHTNVGIEYTFRFRDPLDFRVYASATIDCGQKVGSSSLATE